MNTYADELKTRRSRANMTVTKLAALIDRSATFVTDFELRKKSNPPEPEIMERLAQALQWSVDEQLQAWGYELAADNAARASHAEYQDTNPFRPDDPRYQIVERLKHEIDIDNHDHLFALKYVTSALQLIRDDYADGSNRPTSYGTVARNP